MTREQLFAWFFIGAFLFFLYQFYQVFHFFLVPLTWAALITIVFYPAYWRFAALLRDRRGLAAFLLTTGIILTVMVPTVYLSVRLATQSIDAVQALREDLRSGNLQQSLESLRASLPARMAEDILPELERWNIDLPSVAMRLSNAVSGFLASQATEIASNTLRFFTNFFFVTFAVFFFFRDGERMVQGFRDLVPMRPEHKETILLRIYEILSAVVQGMLLVAVAQGVLVGIGFWIVDVPYAVLLACATALLSLIPFGTPIIWVSVVGYLAFHGHYPSAIFLFIWGSAVVGSVDNVLRPIVIGSRANIPTIFLFFGILGGLQAYGFLGLFLGPALIAILVAFVRIYRELYLEGWQGQQQGKGI